MSRRIGFLLMVLAVLSLQTAHGAAAPAAVAQEGVFVHVSHGKDDPHRLLMALRMAIVMAESGRPVLLYCDILAVTALTKTAPDITHPHFQSARTQLKRLLELGVRVRACPSCLKAAGLLESQLMEGVKLADRDEFFSFASGRILTLDY